MKTPMKWAWFVAVGLAFSLVGPLGAQDTRGPNEVCVSGPISRPPQVDFTENLALRDATVLRDTSLYLSDSLDSEQSVPVRRGVRVMIETDTSVSCLRGDPRAYAFHVVRLDDGTEGYILTDDIGVPVAELDGIQMWATESLTLLDTGGHTLERAQASVLYVAFDELERGFQVPLSYSQGSSFTVHRYRTWTVELSEDSVVVIRGEVQRGVLYAGAGLPRPVEIRIPMSSPRRFIHELSAALREG